MTTPELLSPDLLELLGRIIARARAALSFDYGGIALSAAAEETLTLHLAYPAPATYPIQAGLLRRAAVQRQPILLPDIQPGSPDWAFRPALRAALLIPLALEGQLSGVLLFGSDTPGAYDAEDLRLATALADQAALALDTALRATAARSIAAENVTLIAALEQHAAELREANRLKSEFLANISHELRTPMNAIIGFSETLLSGLYGELNATAADRVERILRNGRGLLALIDDLLDLSRIDAGKLQLAPEPLALEETIKPAVEAVKTRLASKRLSIAVSVPADLPPVEADPTRLRQVLDNLLDNAIKFTHYGGITICAGVEEGVEPARVWCSVTDTGIGIAPENQGIIFDEFRQVDGTSTRQYEGTGLGLAISRRLLSLMNGHIAVESSPGQGSTFTFWLPVARLKPPESYSIQSTGGL